MGGGGGRRGRGKLPFIFAGELLLWLNFGDVFKLLTVILTRKVWEFLYLCYACNPGFFFL